MNLNLYENTQINYIKIIKMACYVFECPNKPEYIFEKYTSIKPNLFFCKKHYEELTNPVKPDECLVIHSTKLNSLENILKSGFLYSKKELIERFGSEYKIKNKDYPTFDSVFTSIIFPNNDDIGCLKLNSKKLNSTFAGFYNKTQDNVYLIFSPEIVSKSKYFTLAIAFGIFSAEMSFKYNKSESLEYNLNLWRILSSGEEYNELLFKRINLSKYLIGIYVSPQNKNIEKYMELSKKYSQYNWCFENFKFID